ncbi:MAG TPA: DUF4386 domain-containing protein [Candidatus Acidoferrum sp.]|nr:DUF4386 domain-containing protein [Candidatus Acidoferrum sp.]
MSSVDSGNRKEGLTLRKAALIAGFAYLLSPVTTAEYSIMPKLVIPGNIEQTVQNIGAHGGLFVAAIFCYLITFLEDVVIAWALYYLLAPVSRSASLLTAWFRLVYTAVVLYGWLNLVTVYRLVKTPEYSTSFGTQQLHAQVNLSLNSFRYDWSISLVIFGIHLVLLGWLIYRSGYIPRIIGILLVIDGLGWVIDSLQPYLYPNAKLGFIFITFFGEVVFMLWLLIRGWKIKEPAVQA